MPSAILTDLAMLKFATAVGTASSVEVTQIALGDGNGANYDPSYDQTELVRERARRDIDTRQLIAEKTWRVRAGFPAEVGVFNVREIGFFDTDGDLIAIWAAADAPERVTGGGEYLIDHVLDFSRSADGVVIVTAPDDDHYLFGLSVLKELADQRHTQFHIREAFHAQHGHYPGA